MLVWALINIGQNKEKPGILCVPGALYTAQGMF